jgi:cyanide hydratase
MAPNVTKKYKAAAVNAEPGWLNLELSVERTIHWINEAGKNGCKLVAFPELCKSMRAMSPFPLHPPLVVLAHLFELRGTLDYTC